MAVEDAQLEALEKDARRTLKLLTSDHHPVVIEFAGSPKAGKSTTIDILNHFYKRVGYKVWAPTEGASKRTPYHLKRDLVAFNTWTLNYAVSELLLAYYNVDHHHIVILDRGPFDSLAWMRLLHARGDLDKEELDVVNKYALHPRWSKLISRLYLFECEPDISLEREHQFKLTRKPGTAMNPEMLADLLVQYDRLRSDSEVDPNVLQTVKTSHETTPLDTSYELALDILKLLRTSAGGVG